MIGPRRTMAGMGAYGQHKALHHLDILQGMRDGKPVRPAHVQVILSDTCNQACGFCSYRDPEYTSSQMFYEVRVGPGGLRKDEKHPERDYNPRRMIDYDKAIEILNDCVAMGTRAVQFTGGGEPTVHPRFAEILEYALNHGLRCAVVTNGVLVRKKELAGLLARCDWVRVSLDAGLASTYCRIRNVPASHFEEAKAAVELIRQERDRLETSCVIGVGFVVTQDNWREVATAACMAMTLGADNVRIGAQFSTEGAERFASFRGAAASLCKVAEGLSVPGFEVINRFDEKVGELEQGRPTDAFCGYQQITTYIGADLNVYRCCVLSYNERGLVGSIAGRRFADLWMSPARVDEMGTFDARDCDRCQFSEINRTIASAVLDQVHSDFV